VPPARLGVAASGVCPGLDQVQHRPHRRSDPLINLAEPDHLQAVIGVAEDVVLGGQVGDHVRAQVGVIGPGGGV
jgi:hypothetical protein